MSQFVIRFAREEENLAVHNFVFGRQQRYLRSRPLEEIEELIKLRTMFIAEREESGQLAAARYLDNTDEQHVEYGGAFTDPDYRGFGLGTTLGRAAIAHYFTMNYKPVPLRGHVHVGNDAPRRLLDRLGFRLVKSAEAYDPQSLPGIAHMPTDPDGMIRLDLFEFEIKQLPRLLREAIQENACAKVRKGQRIEIRVDLFTFKDNARLIRERLAELEKEQEL